MRQKYFLGLGPKGFHRLTYREWGDPSNRRVLICCHGVTRNGRDFDCLAEALCHRWRVVCPDLPGHGGSEWLEDNADYNPRTYRADCTALIARLDVEDVAWLGTSMGGVIGIGLAAQPGTPISRLIVNDIGPFIPGSGLRRIAEHMGADPRFPDLASAEAFLRRAMASFGIRRPKHWRQVTEASTCPVPGGGLRLNYDPGLADGFSGPMVEDTAFWSLWDAIACPVLVLHGTQSDLLLPETVDEMTRRGPRATRVEVPECGHAPMLMDAEQIEAVREWLG